MPANLPPDYYAAEERFRQAKTSGEKIRILEEMLAIMPKHKGTDHLKADLRARISRLEKDSLKKKAVSKFNPYVVEREDCPQVVILGAANTGKSALINRLTTATSEVAEYPYTTTKPYPGIFRHNLFRFQLVDLPPIISTTMEGWMGDLLRSADAAMICLDASQESTLENMNSVFQATDKANVYLYGLQSAQPPLGTIPKKALIALTKCDRADPEVLDLLKSEFQGKFITIETSAVGKMNLDNLSSALADTLQILRIFTKIPGKKADMDEPYIIKRGMTVIEMAETVHRELAESFRFARIWGKKVFDGQRVGKEYLLEDEDIVELHS